MLRSNPPGLACATKQEAVSEMELPFLFWMCEAGKPEQTEHLKRANNSDLTVNGY